jgi:hypothetical protein
VCLFASAVVLAITFQYFFRTSAISAAAVDPFSGHSGEPGEPGRWCQTHGVPAPRVTLLTRPGCHLCADARLVVAAVCAEVGEPWEERDITGDPELLREWTDDVPVTLVDGRHIDSWRVSADRLRRALGR